MRTWLKNSSCLFSSIQSQTQWVKFSLHEQKDPSLIHRVYAKEQDTVVCSYSPNSGRRETRKSLGLTDGPASLA